MNPSQLDHKHDNYLTIQQFEENLQIARNAVTEAKQRIIALERRLHVFMVALIVLLACTTLYGFIQIWQTSRFLQDLGHYVRQERDPRWETWIREIRHNQDVIQSRIDEMQNLWR